MENSNRILVRNQLKTKEINLINNTVRHCIEYLGYSIEFGDGTVNIRLSAKKILKYKARIDLIFTAYKNLAKVKEKKARKILVKRLRFLTGNTRLVNNKKNILVGIYFSNSLVNDAQDILGLDTYLLQVIDTQITKPELQLRLKRYRFIDGFSNKRFSPFKTHELSQIIDPWQNV